MSDQDEAPRTDPQPEWIEIESSGVRHVKAGAKDRLTSVGYVRTDAAGVIIAVAGKLGRPIKLDRQTSQPTAWSAPEEPPSREQILALTSLFVECETHPTQAQAAQEQADAEAAEAERLAGLSADQKSDEPENSEKTQEETEPEGTDGSQPSSDPSLEGASGTDAVTLPSGDAAAGGPEHHLDAETGPDSDETELSPES